MSSRAFPHILRLELIASDFRIALLRLKYSRAAFAQDAFDPSSTLNVRSSAKTSRGYNMTARMVLACHFPEASQLSDHRLPRRFSRYETDASSETNRRGTSRE